MTEKVCNRVQKPHVFLPLSEKLNIIEAINAGESVSSLARQYKISRAAISNLKKTQKLVKVASNLNEMALNRRKVIKRVNNTALEKAIVMWFKEKRSMGQPVTGPMICEKALHFNKLLGGSENFKATTGWLGAFKRRYGIKLSVLPEDQLLSDEDAAKTFCFEFQKTFNQENYNLSLIFNADETGFFYKSLPKSASNSSEDAENELSGWKDNKERVTALFCANANGSHALPLLVIGKSWTSRSSLSTSEKILQLPVMYQNQRSACMTNEIFMDWYTNIFIPSVEEMQEKTGIHGKVLLLIDDAKCHPPREILEAVNENFQVLFIPGNVSPLVQPMAQGIIGRTKMMYRKSFLTALLEADEDENANFEIFMESHTMEECCFMLANAFESVTMINLKNAWKKLFGLSQLDEENDDYDDVMLEVREFCQLIHQIRGFETIYQATVKMWLNADKYDPGWESLSDDEIIEFATRKSKIEIEKVDCKPSIDKNLEENVESMEKVENPRSEKINKADKSKGKNLESKKSPSVQSVEIAIQNLRNWCKKRKEYTRADYRILRKWEALARKDSEENN